MSDNTLEERISAKTDLAVAKTMSVSETMGGLTFQDMGQVLEFSKLMAVSRQAVPKHLREQPGMCMAVTLQALGWRMDPFAVANKSYAVNDRLAYEAQLIQAVIEQRAPIRGRIKGSYEGEGAKRVCVLKVVSAEDGDTIEYRSPEIGLITTKNSPLWRADPDQQLWYYSARAMCRRHFPDVLLGVYEKEEIETAPPMRDVTPRDEAPSGFAAIAMKAREAAKPAEADPAPHWTSTVDTTEAFPGSDVFGEGAQAFTAGKVLADCPYPQEMSEHVDWIGGWQMAARAKE